MSSQANRMRTTPTVLLDHREYVKSVILAKRDKLLDNKTIHATYARQRLMYVDTEHADTVRAMDKYRGAMKEILANPCSEE